MTISITASVTFRHGTNLYTQGQPYAVADNLAHLFIKRNWASGTTNGSKPVTMMADWREGSIRYLAGQTYTIPQPLADFLVEIGVASGTVSWNLGVLSFVRGVASSIDLNDHINNPNGYTCTFGFQAGEASAATVGITLASNGILSYNGTNPGSDTTISGVEFWVDDGVSDTIVQFGLTSTSTGTKPFCFGHPFKQGDIPSGSDVIANIPEFQATITNRWSDGSAKYAILAGRVDLTAGITRYIDLKAGTASSGTALTESNLQALSPSASIAIPSYGTVTLSSLLGLTSSGAKGSPGRVRTRISGPYMSEFHYYSPVGSDNHLATWFYVRLFAGNHIEIETCVENGWLKVASPGVKNYTPTLTINGTARSLGVGALSHYHHTRWAKPEWYGTDPAVTPKHDAAYLRSTGLVPNYGWTTPTSSAPFTGLTSTIVPFQLGDWEQSEGAPGYDEEIGLLPRWEALYCTTADPRVYTATVCNGYSLGLFSIHYRDENTLRPLAFSSYPNLVTNDPGISSSGASTTNDYTPLATGGTNGTFSTSHHPSWAYLPYLLTGRWFFLEELQFCATLNFLKNTNTNRLFSQGVLQSSAGANQPRGAAWALRTLAQAVCMTPDGDSLQTELRNSYQSNVDYYHTNYVGSANHLGVVATGGNYDAGSGHTSVALWMDDFITASLGWGLDMDLPLVSASKTKHRELVLFKAQCPVGRTGGQSATEWCYRKAANYNSIIAPTETFSTLAEFNSVLYANWGDAYVANFGPNDNCALASSLTGGNIDFFGFQQSYWGNYLPAISAAVNVGAPGASAAYARLTSASNWAASTAEYNNNPTWGIVPRI